jgi:hypothetical protein
MIQVVGSQGIGLKVGISTMNFVAENRVDPDDQTRGVGSSLTAQNSYPATEYLVAIQQNRQLVKVFRPREKSIFFGRSSRCSINISDPKFSRKAGEIVLGPVPIMRRYRNGEKKSDFIPIQPGKIYRFRPYTLTLLEPGDIIFNRYKNNNGKKARLLGSMLFIIVILCSGSIVLRRQGMSDTPANAGKGNASFSAAGEQNRNEITVKRGNKGKGEPMEKRKLASSEPTVEKKTKVSGKIPGRSTPISPRRKSAAVRISSRTEKKNRKVALHADELDKTIKAAVSLIEQGDFKTAGRTLSPLMPHINNEQRRKMIDSLDPLVQNIFQNAYMIKPYEPGRSREILQGILESELEILPGYGKAKRVWESERITVIGDR